MSQTSSNKSSKSYEKFFNGILEIVCAGFRIFSAAFSSKFYRKKENWVLYLSLVLLVFITYLNGNGEYFLEFLSLTFLRPIMVAIAKNFSFFSIFVMIAFAVGAVFIFFLGLKPYRRFRMYQKGIDHLNMKSGLDHQPKLLRVDEIDENRTRLLVKSTGLGEERYKSKLDDLRASVGQKVESLKYFDKDNTCVEIFLARKLLESKVLYSDLALHLKRPYSFIVGKSQKGIVTESLEDVPHFLIGGSTGGGKSVSFKSLLIGLLESSTRLQLYLFDFKKVEMNDFRRLPNVSVVNDEFEAQQVLAKLEKEMERRYDYLEKKGFKSIDPERDKMDRIVVGIDECTDLTGKVSKSNASYVTVEKARNSLDHLARKARASGIHLIFATQKIDRDSMDTRVQENIEGRIALRMNTMENSVRVLQNSMAYHLPAIPGRAIWKKGASYTEVQIPFLNDEEIRTKVQNLIKTKKFEKIKLFDLPVQTSKNAGNLKGLKSENAS